MPARSTCSAIRCRTSAGASAARWSARSGWPSARFDPLEIAACTSAGFTMDAGPLRALPESNVSLMVILTLAVQVGLIAHVIKTGRSMIWILALAFLPLAGPLAYVVVEILPEVFGGRTARRARSGVGRMLDPDRDLRRAAAEVEVSGNVDARRRLADELCERGQFEKAAEVYQGGLKGI